MRPARLYWDCTCYGRHYPDGIGRFTVALAERRYALPSTYLLPPYLAGGPLHRALERCPGDVVVAGRHPRRRYPWRWWWEQVLAEPGIVLAAGNFHRPCRRWPSAVVVHDIIPYTEPAYAAHAHCSREAYARLLHRADALLAVSAFTADELRRVFPAAPPALPLRQGLFPPPPERAPAGAPDAPFYLFVGGAEPRKRLELAVQTAASLDDAPLVVVGRDWDAQRSVASLTTGWRGRHPLLRLDAVDDAELQWLYGRCRALLYPTRVEGFGLPGLECLRAGRPVVAERRGALPETLGPGAIWHDFADGDIAVLRSRIAAWTPDATIEGHVARFSWDAARDALDAALAPLIGRCASSQVGTGSVEPGG